MSDKKESDERLVPFRPILNNVNVYDILFTPYHFVKLQAIVFASNIVIQHNSLYITSGSMSEQLDYNEFNRIASLEPQGTDDATAMKQLLCSLCRKHQVNAMFTSFQIAKPPHRRRCKLHEQLSYRFRACPHRWFTYDALLQSIQGIRGIQSFELCQPARTCTMGPAITRCPKTGQLLCTSLYAQTDKLDYVLVER